MGQEGFGATNRILQPGVAFLGEGAVAGQLAVGVGLLDIFQFFSGQIGFVKRNHQSSLRFLSYQQQGAAQGKPNSRHDEKTF